MIEWVQDMAPADSANDFWSMSCMNGDELVGTVELAADDTWTARNTEGITQYRFVTVQDAKRWVEGEAR